MKVLWILLIAGLLGTLFPLQAVWAASPASVKSYKEWKSEKIQEAQSRLEGLKTRLQEKKKLDPNLTRVQGTEAHVQRDAETARLESQVAREQNNLEMAQELTVSDYFAGYLTKLSNKNAAFKEVSGRLTPEEVADLMAAYANSMFGSQSNTLPAKAIQGAGSDAIK